jgi:hypothetical protein
MMHLRLASYRVSDFDPSLTLRTAQKLVAALMLSVAVSACDSSTFSTGSRQPSDHSTTVGTRTQPLRLVEAPTPPLQVPKYETRGTYPQVRGGHVDLGAVNAAIRAAVLANQRAYAPYARKEKTRVAIKDRGVYGTAVDRKLVSASTVVVSALMPLTREVFPGQHGGDGWLAVTASVPSGARVTITDLFANPKLGLRVLARSWKARIRGTSAGRCLRAYPTVYRPSVENYGAFALTPAGVAVGSWEVGACYRLMTTVPYRVLRPHLSKLGVELVAGVRTPA